MIGFNRLRADTTVNDEALRRTVTPWATYVGVVTHDSEVASSLDLARTSVAGPYRELVDAVLHRVTGLAVFAPTGPVTDRPHGEALAAWRSGRAPPTPGG